MSMSKLLQFLVIASTFSDYVQSFPTFQWPNTLLSYADKQVYEGPITFGSLTQGCLARDDTTVSAQWLRIAYHDMSTHDVDDGTGGLDASIMYELDRPQNVGIGLPESLADFNGFGTAAPFFGMADMIALGAIFAVAGCGGPLIPFSAGRVDATLAGPPTVPEPQQDLASHLESFRRQGFNETEMIALVACGHTLGGVRQVDFPLIVTDTTIDVDTFDTTPTFDNTIVSQYLQNTTQDVLVVGPNITTRSDYRIFSSDGNATMQTLLSPATFSDTCASLLERMINTVPSTVTLTDPIAEPFDYVVNEPFLSYQDDTFFLTTALRVLNPNPEASVTMLWVDQQGDSVCPTTGCTVGFSGSQPPSISIIGQAQGITAERYFFNATVNATSSISKFWFEINNNDGSDPIIVNNGGSGYVINQNPTLSLFVDVLRSEGVFTPSTGVFFKIVVAILGDASEITDASMTSFEPFSSAPNPPFIPPTTLIPLVVDESNPPEGGYTFLTGNVSSVTVTFLHMITANVGGTIFTVENFDLLDAANSFPIVDESTS